MPINKKKALGQDPLAWIKLTQEEEKRKQEATAAAGDEAAPPAPAAPSGMNWSFLAIYIVNMAILLVLVFVLYADLNSSLKDIGKEVERLQERVHAIETVTPAPADSLRPAPTTPPARP